MTERKVATSRADLLDRVLGYLNFSSGASDIQFLASLNQLYGRIERLKSRRDAPWAGLHKLLADRLEVLAPQNPAFGNADQARAVVELVFRHVLPGYREFHRDLLFHQSDRVLFNAFFVGRACEAVLCQGPAWDDTSRIESGAISQLSDYIGYRPVPALETRKTEPYPREWTRPVPLYIRGAGVAVGPYREVVEQALALLEQTDESILRAAGFDPKLLDEMAFDARAFDFDHPANKRPNYQFGQWDPHHLDQQGRYRRFVVQLVTLDSLVQRIDEEPARPRRELLIEAAAALAGTVLMASGITGGAPGSHDSTVTMSTLVPRIAAYRDAFYEDLMERLSGAHARRLLKESGERHQAFGGARQHLNACLARRRAAQLEHVHLAKAFARMGYAQAAAEEAEVVPAASARTLCQMDCRLTAAHHHMDAGRLEAAATLLPEVVDRLHAAIECGAVVDPWNIIGFDAQFSLFPSIENSIYDDRVDELLELMDRLFAAYSRLWKEAAAADDQPLCVRVGRQFEETSRWFRQFAAHEVSTVEATDPLQVYQAAEHVARALNLWHKGGAASGDVSFWASHTDLFRSPEGYALVIDALLEKRDFVASMALLVHWLSQSSEVPLERGDSSFHAQALRWLREVGAPDTPAATDATVAANRPRQPLPHDAHLPPSPDAWSLVQKFFDYIEANAESYGKIPSFELASPADGGAASAELADGPQDALLDDDAETEAGLFDAAYEDVVYRDSTDDGVDASIFESPPTPGDELEAESRRLVDHLAFLSTLARLWQDAVLRFVVSGMQQPCDASPAVREGCPLVERLAEQASENLCGLLRLLATVHRYRLPTARGDHDSLVEYDRQRLLKESLLEQIITTCVAMADARRMLAASHAARRSEPTSTSADAASAAPTDLCPAHDEDPLETDEPQVVAMLSALMRRDARLARDRWDDLRLAFQNRPLLYVPLARGGTPAEIAAVRARRRTIQDLLAWMPRLGLLTETRQLLETAREMERSHSVGSGAVTEFDELFGIGYKALVESLVISAQTWATDDPAVGDSDSPSAVSMVECLERLTELLLTSWLAHSRTLRLSVLEKVKDAKNFATLTEFIGRYGDELFTQKFLGLGNLRGILHQGVDVWLRQLEIAPDDAPCPGLLDDLDQRIPRGRAVDLLTTVLESVVENYGEYRDYNTTTTQSDRGEMLYTLLDFLRLRVQYDRISWNLKPIVWAHEILVRHGQREAAALWRRVLSQRMGDEADKLLVRLKELQARHAMSMPTIADRLAERFVRPMDIDRVRALVEPAVREAALGGKCPAFEELRRETTELTREPTGAGLDVPAWLAALEEEVDRVCRPGRRIDDEPEPRLAIAPVSLSWDEAWRQLEQGESE